MTNMNEETFLQDFVVILKRTLENYYKILNKCFHATTWTVFTKELMSLVRSVWPLSVAQTE